MSPHEFRLTRSLYAKVKLTVAMYAFVRQIMMSAAKPHFESVPFTLFPIRSSAEDMVFVKPVGRSANIAPLFSLHN